MFFLPIKLSLIYRCLSELDEKLQLKQFDERKTYGNLWTGVLLLFFSFFLLLFVCGGHTLFLYFSHSFSVSLISVPLNGNYIVLRVEGGRQQTILIA